MDTRDFEQLLVMLGRLTRGQREKVQLALNRLPLSEQTVQIIQTRLASGASCPHCGATHLHRYGQAHGLQRYRCTACSKTFNALTGTPLARLRHKAKWLDYLQCMLDSQTIRQAAQASGVHRNTSFRWRHRFLKWAKDDRPTPLHGITEADETYLLESALLHKSAVGQDMPNPKWIYAAATVWGVPSAVN